MRQPDRLSVRSPRSWSLVAAVAAAVGSAANAQQSTPVGTFSVRVNGGAMHTVQSVATSNAEAGTVRFTGSSVDPSGMWDASWDYVADLDPNGNAKLVGMAKVKNASSAPAEFEIFFSAPLCPYIQDGAKMGGSCTIKIIMDANGGAITTAPGNQVFAAMADSVAGPKLFHGPFNMGSTGSGTAQTANVFGAPFPGATVGAVQEDFGVRHLFKLTDGDAAEITSNLILGGDPSKFVSCAPQEAAQGGPPAAPAAPPAAPPAAVQQPFAAPPLPGAADAPAPVQAVPAQALPAQAAPAPAAIAPVQRALPASSAVVVNGGGNEGKKVISAGPSKGTQAKKAAPPKRAPTAKKTAPPKSAAKAPSRGSSRNAKSNGSR
jgi:hypothetical protein